MTTQTAAPPSSLERGVLDAMEALTECPVCRVSLYALGLYREDGRIVVVCPVCESGRDFADAHTPSE